MIYAGFEFKVNLQFVGDLMSGGYIAAHQIPNKLNLNPLLPNLN